MKENRLKALELKTQALRIRSEKKPATPTPTNNKNHDGNTSRSNQTFSRNENVENNSQIPFSSASFDESKFYQYLAETKEVTDWFFFFFLV